MDAGLFDRSYCQHPFLLELLFIPCHAYVQRGFAIWATITGVKELSVHRGWVFRRVWRRPHGSQPGLVTGGFALIIILLSSVAPAIAGTPIQLTDNQLDKVNAGSIALASGVGAAQGTTQATTIAATGTAIGPGDALASGQVTSISTSQSNGAETIAAAKLSISISLTGR